MSFTIGNFVSAANAVKGFQRLNRYRVRFATPLGLLNRKSVNGQIPSTTTNSLMEFWCNTADLPGSAVLAQPFVRYGFGVAEKMPTSPLFNDMMMTFYNDSRNNNLNFFHQWKNIICNFDDATPVAGQEIYELSYKGDYMVDAYLTLFDTAGHETYTMVMRQLYPVLIPETKLSMDPQPTVMQIVVLFTYVDWYILNPNTAGALSPIPIQTP